jgi:diamine N-acetyltransferase
MIKPCGPEEAEALYRVALRVFVDTFAPHNTPENMADYVSKTYSIEHQLREIRDPVRVIAMAWHGTNAVGYYQLYIHPAEPCVTGHRPIELLRLYVDQSMHGRGVARQLLAHAETAAMNLGFETLWLGVWDKNFRAQRFYEKEGFKKVGSHEFVMGTDAQTDWIMQKSMIRHA